MKTKHLVLASTSIFRRKLLESTGLDFSSVGPTIDESTFVGKSPQETAQLRARAKAIDVAKNSKDALIIGADQVLGMGDRSFDKAQTIDEARRRLKEFSGNVHVLYSAMALVLSGKNNENPVFLEEIVVPVEMRMRRLTENEIENYLATNEWQGCVGCYRYEEQGAHLMESAGGDSSAIIGLPLLPLLAALRRHGFTKLG